MLAPIPDRFVPYFENPNAHALLIGIADYDDGSSVPSALNNVRLWLSQCARMGIPRENILLLTNPRIPDNILPAGIEQGSPSHANIIECLHRLAVSATGTGGQRGLFVFSGHGALVEGKSVICAQDFDSLDRQRRHRHPGHRQRHRAARRPDQPHLHLRFLPFGPG